MTSTDRTATGAAARAIAVEAAARAHVRIEQVRDLAGLRTVCAVVDDIWRPPTGASAVRVDLLRALTHAGNYCVLARDGSRPMGACFGFLSVDPARDLHSHIAGVTAAAAGRHVGRAIKLDQRAWALEHSLTTVSWTFDPLIRRNAFFNASRLGALPTRYLIDFYGPMNDTINAGQPSDRVQVSWLLDSPRVQAICAGREPARPVAALLDGGPAVVLEAVGDVPVRREVDPATGVRLVQLPADIEALRRVDPGLAGEWRLAVRETLGALMADGWIVTEFGRDGYYVLEPASEHIEEDA